jgi:hypothetical protein
MVFKEDYSDLFPSSRKNLDEIQTEHLSIEMIQTLAAGSSRTTSAKHRGKQERQATCNRLLAGPPGNPGDPASSTTPGTWRRLLMITRATRPPSSPVNSLSEHGLAGSAVTGTA